MQSSALKNARFDPAIESPKTPILVKSFLPELESSGLSSGPSFFPSLAPLIAQPTNLFSFLSHFLLRISADHQQSRLITRQSSPIGSEGQLNLLLAACQKAEKEAEAEKGGNSSSLNSLDIEETIFHTAFLDDGLSEVVSLSSEEENEWEEDEGKWSSSWINSGNTLHAKEKLIQILAGKALVQKQKWSLRKILATLVYHQNDPCLYTTFRQFCSFAFQTIMTESERGGRWPGSLTCKNCNVMIRCNAGVTRPRIT